MSEETSDGKVPNSTGQAPGADKGNRHEASQTTDIPPHWDIAKWLIPSVGALFIVIGYLANLAHHAFLGFDPGLLEPNEYLATSGDFLRYVLRAPVSGALAWSHALFDGVHLLSVVPTLVSAAGCTVWHAWAKRRDSLNTKRICRIAIGIFLGMAVVLRLVTMDAPVAKLQGALVVLSETPEERIAASAIQPGSAPNTSSPTQPVRDKTPPTRYSLTDRLDREASNTDGLARLVAERAKTLWVNIRCTRTASYSEALSSTPSACNKGVEAPGTIEGEGLAHLLMTGAIIWLACLALLDHPGPWRAGLAWISIFSCLTLALTFGKLGHVLDYDFVRIVMKTPLEPDKSEHNEAARSLEGIVLQMNKDWTTLAVSSPIDCKGGVTSEVKIWRISNGEVLWEKDIYRTDVLQWAAAKTFHSCTENHIDSGPAYIPRPSHPASR